MTQEEKEEKIAELEKRLAELRAMPVNKRWEPSYAQFYYFVDTRGRVSKTQYAVYNEFMYEVGNCFMTREEAEYYAKKIKLQTDYRNWCEDYSKPIDWHNRDQVKCYAFYDYRDNKIHFSCDISTKPQGIIYASSEKIIQEFIDKVGEEDFIRYVLEVEE